MKKKLLLVVTKSNWGGAQRYVYDIALSLRESYEVVVAAGGTGVPGSPPGRLARELQLVDIRFVYLKNVGRDVSFFGSDIASLIELTQLCRAERPSIVHLNSSKIGGVGALAARLAFVPRIIYTVHGWAFNEPVSWSAQVFRWIASLATMVFAHRTIAVSDFDRVHAPLGLRATTIHNGITAERLLTREEARAHIGKLCTLPPDAFIIGTIAELHHNKGIDILIQATYLVDDIQVVLISDGEERAYLETLVGELDLTSRVHFLGTIPHAARLIPAFDLFVLPSRKEGLPYTILEAGLAHVPVVAAAVGGVAEIIHDQQTGELFHSDNDEALAEVIRELRESPNTRERYAEALFLHVQHHFSLKEMVRKTKEVYES